MLGNLDALAIAAVEPRHFIAGHVKAGVLIRDPRQLTRERPRERHKLLLAIDVRENLDLALLVDGLLQRIAGSVAKQQFVHRRVEPVDVAHPGIIEVHQLPRQLGIIGGFHAKLVTVADDIDADGAIDGLDLGIAQKYLLVETCLV